MTFNSIQFFLFFAVVVALYYRLDGRNQNRLVVVAASVLYATFDWRFLGLLYTAIGVNYVVGRALGRTDDARRRKALVGTSLAVGLGILAFFKYFDFFADSVTDVLSAFGLSVNPPLLEVLLPIGISFYTFQTIGYVLMVYRRQLPAEEDLVTFAAFGAWFPQTLAGPIERPNTLLPQLRRHRQSPSPETVESAVWLILQGLVKKVVISDSLAATVNSVYATPETYGAVALVIATIGFAVQTYGDFSGYSDMARGVSRLLGVELRRNFEQPFLSRNMQEFWQRWHTSLGWWFLEFVGRPLARLRRGPRWSAVVTLVIFALIGLWHGPAWTFVAWGVFNGALVVAWRRRPIPAGQDPDRVRLVEAPRILLTTGLFTVGAILFRAASFGDAVEVIGRILTMRPGLAPPASALLVPVMAVAVLVIDLAERRRRVAGIEAVGMRTTLGGVARPEEVRAEAMTVNTRPVTAGTAVGLMLVALVVFSGGTPTPFLYFQF